MKYNNDFEDDDIADDDLIAVITDGNWIVSSFLHESDLTSQFNGFVFTFLTNGNAIAVSGGTTVNGSWNTSGDDGELELDLEFEEFNEGFDEIGEDWTVVSFNATTITLSHDEDTLIFTKQ